MIKIDKASCLCLDTRAEERWPDIANMEKRLTKLDVCFEHFIANTQNNTKTTGDYFDVVDPDVSKWGYGREGYKHHHWNAFQCHKIMIQRAIDEGRENLLLLEDDAYLPDRFESVWEKASKLLNPDQFDILYLGWWVGNENDEWNNTVEKTYKEKGAVELMKATQVGGLHGALINKNMFRPILELEANNPIDCQLNRVHRNINSFVLLPKIIHTRTTHSICEGNVITRNEL